MRDPERPRPEPTVSEARRFAPRTRPFTSRRGWYATIASLVAVAAVLAAAQVGTKPSVQVNAGNAAPTPSPDDFTAELPPIQGPEPLMPPPPTDMAPTTAPPRLPEPAMTPPQAPTTASRPPMPGHRTVVASADDGRWTLTRVDDGPRRCLELAASSSTTGRLLCDATAEGQLWGPYATIATPLGPMVVAMVDARVSDLGTLFGGGIGAKLARDPRDQALHYAVGVIGNLGGGRPEDGLDLFLMDAAHTLGRTVVSVTTGDHPAPDVVTAPPYGTWPGYTRAGYTGFFWGGNEDVGFYDDPSGGNHRCVLWRRFGGPAEAVIADECPPPTDTLFPFAQVRTEPQTAELVRPAVVVDSPDATSWSCTWDTGEPCGFSGTVIADPAGSGRSLLGYFPGAFPRRGDQLTITVSADTRTLGTITVPVRPATG